MDDKTKAFNFYFSLKRLFEKLENYPIIQGNEAIFLNSLSNNTDNTYFNEDTQNQDEKKI